MLNRFLTALQQNIIAKGDGLFCSQVGAGGRTDISWARLGQDIERYAAAYREVGVTKGDQVLIFMRHVPDLYGSFFGAMVIGAVPAFMPPSSPKQDPELYWGSHQKIIEKISPSVIIFSNDLFVEAEAANLCFGSSRILIVEDVGAGACDWQQVDESHVGLLQHSSGTTGLKKGVALSFRSIADQLEAYSVSLALQPDDSIVSWLPLYHDMGLIAALMMPTYFGLKVVHIDPFLWVRQPDLLFREIERIGGTLSWTPNFALEHLALVNGRKAQEYNLNTVRAMINCSEPVKAQTFDRFERAFVTSGLRREALQCCYAMAETVFAVTQTAIAVTPARFCADPRSLNRGCIPAELAMEAGGEQLLETGSPIPGVELRFLDEAGEPLSEGVIGEISVSAPFLFSGYNKDDERTSQCLQDGWYRTHDIGFMRQGRLYVLGRADDMIIINGRNIYAHEVESLLGKLEGIKPGRVVVVGQSDPQTGSHALLVLAERAEGSTLADADLRTAVIRAVFSVFEVTPKRVVLYEAGHLIKTTSGKISRSANLKRYEERSIGNG